MSEKCCLNRAIEMLEEYRDAVKKIWESTPDTGSVGKYTDATIRECIKIVKGVAKDGEEN